jgi:RalA-binding protein 1
VLSFIIVVDPGNRKETWKVEKLYSDVLSLDQRIRASVGKGVGKKIASLPEGKLWRDHAPAKVDQRKVSTGFPYIFGVSVWVLMIWYRLHLKLTSRH